jgi:hypothetical protein
MDERLPDMRSEEVYLTQGWNAVCRPDYLPLCGRKINTMNHVTHSLPKNLKPIKNQTADNLLQQNMT